MDIYLCAASGVLRRTAGNEHSVVVLDQVVVEPEVLLFGENGIVGLQAVLLEELLITISDPINLCPENAIIDGKL